MRWEKIVISDYNDLLVIVEKLSTWIAIEKELPEKFRFLRTKKIGDYEYTSDVFIKTRTGQVGISKRSRPVNSEKWQWKGSIALNKNITHWRLIDLDSVYTVKPELLDTLINLLTGK